MKMSHSTVIITTLFETISTLPRIRLAVPSEFGC